MADAAMSVASELRRLLLPNCCVACERKLEAGRPDDLVCAVCLSRLRPVLPGCERCGQPLPLVGECSFCKEWGAELRQVRSAVWLTDEARAIMHHFKYDDYPMLATVAANVMARRMPRPARGVLVPVPLGAGKMRMRGYNQALLLARALAAAWCLPVNGTVLRRTRDTTTQTALTPHARLANVATAFAAVPAAAADTAILVDDVFTTGATLRAAAAALAGAGWRSITGVTFARALTFDLRALVQH